ncbi:hypothetical protein ACFL0N_01425 [Pseudomonadota bacterium]
MYTHQGVIVGDKQVVHASQPSKPFNIG